MSKIPCLKYRVCFCRPFGQSFFISIASVVMNILYRPASTGCNYTFSILLMAKNNHAKLCPTYSFSCICHFHKAFTWTLPSHFQGRFSPFLALCTTKLSTHIECTVKILRGLPKYMKIYLSCNKLQQWYLIWS